ncbi:MAG TPA: sigma-70 family RNA polymerase sigma factor [Verrucomicrobiae bacterium]|nr:sigma-70 family RNA polymerase sigma factor [Verrucomicrobiae bacterium]
MTVDYEESSERELLALARKGNDSAFTELVRRNWHMIYRVSRRVVKNHEDAEDTLQNVLVKVYQRLNGFEEASRFSSWLFRVTFNEALMTLRRNRSRHQDSYVDLDYSDGNGHGVAELQDVRVNNEKQHMHRELAFKAMHRLSPSLRRAFLLHKHEGWTHREMAEELGITQATAKMRVFRARRQLREELEVLTR